MVDKEAELQAHLLERLRGALPMLPANIELEHHLHLRLGHAQVVVDGRKPRSPAVRGRYDMLVRIDGRPLLLVELKAPGVPITDADVDQGLSYARTHEPLVPITVATNGTVTRIHRSYDGAALDPDDLVDDRLEKMLANVTALAASATRDAILTLLGSCTAIWQARFAKWTRRTLDKLTGSAREIGNPLMSDFQIPREVTRRIERALARGHNLVVVHGGPLTGVTNVLAELASTLGETRPALYVDALETPNVLQDIANRMSQELMLGISKDDVRHWLNTGSVLVDATLIIDGLPSDDLDEIIGFAKAGQITLVLGMNSETLRTHAHRPGRKHRSAIGDAPAFEVEALTDQEFSEAMRMFEAAHDAVFGFGADRSPELRQPRVLRVYLAQLDVAATLPLPSLPASGLPDAPVVTLLPAIPGMGILDGSAWLFGREPEIHDVLARLARAYLAGIEAHCNDPDWLAAMWGAPAVELARLEQAIGSDRVRWLRELGFVSLAARQGVDTVVVIRVEELLDYHIAQLWAAELSRIGLTDDLLELCNRIPTGARCLARAVSLVVARDGERGYRLVTQLVRREPSVDQLGPGAIVQLLTKDGRNIRILFEDGMDEPVVGRSDAWLVLSYLASLPMATDDGGPTVNAKIFATLGAFPHLIVRPPPALASQAMQVHTHNIEGIGTVACMDSGIFEPLIQSMIDWVHCFPHELPGLAEHATNSNSFPLAWRILQVARVGRTSVSPEVAQACDEAIELLDPWCGDMLRTHVTSGP